MQQKTDIAIFGGSFNPVHFGHFEIVRQLNLQFKFVKIFIVPAYKNPLKERLPSIPEHIRLKMLSETYANFDNVEISRYELDKQKTSYSYITLQYFRKRYPDHQFFLILGEDALASFHLWEKADRILNMCTIVAFRRPSAIPSTHRQDSATLPEKVCWVNARIPDISATEIRTTGLDTIKRNRWLHPNALPTWELFAGMCSPNNY